MKAMERPTYTASMDRLIRQFSRLPGIGKRSAERITFYLLKANADEARELSQALTDLRKNTRTCRVCGNVAETDPCPICNDPQRDQGLVLVVEQPKDVASFETTGLYKGVYHVLMGRLAPLEGVGPGELNVQLLLDRVKRADPPVREVILGTNPTLEGDGTALYLSQTLHEMGVSVTRLARGLPTGSNLEMVSKAVLADAISGRQKMS